MRHSRFVHLNTMKQGQLFAMMICLFGLGLFVAALAPLAQAQQPRTFPKWEYRIVLYRFSEGGQIDFAATNRLLNELGDEGWELVAVPEQRWIYLKRPKR